MNTKLEDYIDSVVLGSTGVDLHKHDLRLPGPWPLADRLDEGQVAQIVTNYQAGATSRELADRFGVGKTALVRLLRQHGADIRRPGRAPSTQE